MTTARRLAVLAAVASPLWLAGCDNKCPTETPQVSSVPSCAGMAPNTQVTVQVRICPTCNQTVPECQVLPPGADGIIQLDALVQACDPSSSCPSPSCNLNPLSCAFRSPGPGSYTILIADGATGQPVEQPFIVAAGGTNTTCSPL